MFSDTVICIPVYPEKLVELIKRDYKGAVVCPLPWCENELQLELSNIFTRLTMTSKEKERAKKTGEEVKMTDVFTPHKECDKPRVVLIEGQPGMGKTIFCQKLAYDWSVVGIPTEASFPDVKILLVLKCRDMKMMNANIEEAIDDQILPLDADKKEKENFFEFIRRNQSKILLVLDGLDELRHDLLQGFLPLIKGKVFSNTYLMLTARHEAGMEIRRYCDTLLDIVGYTSEDADSYITKYFRNHEDPSLGNALIEKLKYDGQLRELTANPLNTALLCLVCEETKGALPSNKTKLYGDLVSFALRRDFARKNENVPSDPIETCVDQLNQLGKMALEALKDDRMYFIEDEMKRHSINFLKCFLSREASISKVRPTACYAFTHKTFQEFFAAFYLEHEMFACDKPRRDALLAQLSPVDKYWQVWEFLFSMVVNKSHDDAIYLLSRLCACLYMYHKKPENLIEAESNATLNAHIGEDTCFSWIADIERLSKEEEQLQSLLTKALDLIAECESDENELKDYQKKMVLTLARCFPLRKFGFDENLGDWLVVSEYLKANRSLTHLHLDGNLDEEGLATVKIVLQPDHKLVHLSLSLSHFDELSFQMNAADDAHQFCDVNKMQLLKVEALAEFLQGNRTLTHLNLSFIPYSGTSVLARAFQFNRTLTHLTLAWSIIDSVEAEALAEALLSNCSLTHLSLPRNSIVDFGAEAFAKVLLLDCGLLYLDLGGNCISDGGVIALAQTLEQGPGLASNATLTYLDLSQQYFAFGSARLICLLENGIIGEFGASALARALRTNCSLTYLNLGYNAIGETGAAAIGEALQSNCNLTHLYLTKNKIGDRGAEALAKALRSERTFTQLDPLQQSSIDDSGVAEFHFALVKAIHGSCSIRVSRLELNRNNICCSGAIALADALLSNSTLERLGLNSNKIACSGAEALAKALQSNRPLAHLDLGGNKIGDSGATEFAETLNKNYTLTYLDLSSNQIGEVGAQNLARVDQSTCTLKYDECYSEK